MDNLFEEGVQQFIKYQKNTENRKSQAQKKREKLQKLRADLKDPVQRRQRHLIRRQQQKNKLQKQLSGLTLQQVRAFLNAKRDKKKQAKKRNLQALKDGMPILIDLVYQKRMNEKENLSLACQIELIMRVVKHIENPPGVHLCSVQGGIKTQLEKMEYHHWILESNVEDVLHVGQRLEKRLIYLSPDATQSLTEEEVDDNTAFIIGGLVDRSVIKNASLMRARELKVQARNLPIRQFMKNRACLNLDHVLMILCKFKETKDWKIAFDYGAPKRWKRDQESKKTNKSSHSSSGSNNDEQNDQGQQQTVKEQQIDQTSEVQTSQQKTLKDCQSKEIDQKTDN